MSRTARRTPVAALVLVAACSGPLTGCGVQLDDAPRPLAAETVPFGLLETSTTVPGETPTTDAPLPTFQDTSVFLVDNSDLLVEVRRQLPGEVRLAILSLLTPPTEAEVNSGLRTAIPSTIGVRSVDGPDDGLVTIDLGSDQSDASPDIPRLAFAQLVYTATAVADVDRVLFQVDGEAREVPTGEGQSTAEPLSEADYRRFATRPTTTTQPDSIVPGG